MNDFADKVAGDPTKVPCGGVQLLENDGEHGSFAADVSDHVDVFAIQLRCVLDRQKGESRSAGASQFGAAGSGGEFRQSSSAKGQVGAGGVVFE